jgi:hypothetical protein
MASALGVSTGSEWHRTATSVVCSWYQRSAEQGHVLSMFNLGTCYRTGEGVGKDLTIAYKCAAQCIRFDRSLECHVAPWLGLPLARHTREQISMNADGTRWLPRLV